MRKIAQRECKPVPDKIKIPYTWTRPQMGEQVQIETSDRHFHIVAYGEISNIETITDSRWSYEVTVTEIL